ncbi:hypothetical protein [Paraburkholderia piptadeniae]|nr:hypothetical protein [Paraburkholderia piptadeniae]
MIHLDHDMGLLDIVRISLQDDVWDSRLRAFFARVLAGLMH